MRIMKIFKVTYLIFIILIKIIDSFYLLDNKWNEYSSYLNKTEKQMILMQENMSFIINSDKKIVLTANQKKDLDDKYLLLWGILESISKNVYDFSANKSTGDLERFESTYKAFQAEVAEFFTLVYHFKIPSIMESKICSLIDCSQGLYHNANYNTSADEIFNINPQSILIKIKKLNVNKIFCKLYSW